MFEKAWDNPLTKNVKAWVECLADQRAGKADENYRIAWKILADEVVATLLEGTLDPHVYRVEVAGQHGVAAEVAEVTPDVRHAIIGVGALPHGLSLAVVIEHDVSVYRHGSDVGLDAVVDFPILAFVPEQPCHLQPLGIGVGGLQRLIYLTAHTTEVFGLPARRDHLIEDVDAIDMVGAVELYLFLDELLLDDGIQLALGVKELAPTGAVEARPVAQRGQWRIGINPCDARWHVACKTRQHGLHIQLALAGNDLLLQLFLVLKPRDGQRSTPAVDVLHTMPRQVCRTGEVTADLLVGESKVAPHFIPHALLSRDSQW